MLAQISLLFVVLSFLARALIHPSNSNVEAFVGDSANPRVLLLTAHPDDECMFFAPTVTSLLASPPVSVARDKAVDPKIHAGVEVYSLCLSVGDADGLGDVRRAELARSLDVLGIQEDKRWVVDHPDLPDNITLFWNEQLVADTIKSYVLEHKISTILTFDRVGISAHPNHMSLYKGAAHLIASLSTASTTPPPRLFILVTVPLVHKYIGPFSAGLAKFDFAFASVLQRFGSRYAQGLPVFVSGIDAYKTTLRAMMEHRSQLVWFRWLYVLFSRYMWVNEWVEVVPPSHTSAGSKAIPV